MPGHSAPSSHLPADLPPGARPPLAAAEPARGVWCRGASRWRPHTWAERMETGVLEQNNEKLLYFLKRLIEFPRYCSGFRTKRFCWLIPWQPSISYPRISSEPSSKMSRFQTLSRGAQLAVRDRLGLRQLRPRRRGHLPDVTVSFSGAL